MSDLEMFNRNLMKALVADNDKLRVEVERLTAWALEERGKVERLTVALREIAEQNADGPSAAEVARAALEGK